MRPTLQSPTSGAVVLVALCFTAVLGIAVATYLALCSRVMSLSDRTFHSANSGALAQLGVEQALYALNNNTWTNWTNTSGGALSSTDTVALRTLPVGSHSVYIRFNNRNATNWSSGLAYTTADIVWYLGKWYQCTTAHSATTTVPIDSGANWASAPGRWNSLVSYSSGDIVIQSGAVYRCTGVDNTNQQPPNTTFWTSVTADNWSSSNNYAMNEVAWHGGTLYRCITPHSNQVPPNTAYWASAPVIYAEGAAVIAGTNTANIETQLRAGIEPAPLFPNALGATQSSSSAVSAASATGRIDSYNSLTGAYSSVGSAENYSAVIAGPSVSISGATAVRGHVATTSSSLATTTTVKSASSPASPNTDPSRVSTSYFVPSFTVNSITDGTTLDSSGAGTNTYLYEGSQSLGTSTDTAPKVYNITATYDSGWLYSGLYLDDSTDILTINGPVVLNVTGDIYINSGRIVIASTGSLILRFTSELWVGNSTSSGGGIYNQAPSTTNPDPRRVLLIGTSTYNSSSYHYYWSREPFYGLIYMPNAYLHMWNSGYSGDRFGALAARNVYYQHAAYLHYDTSLRITGGLGTYVNAAGTRISVIDAPFQVSRLRELTDPAERITLP